MRAPPPRITNLALLAALLVAFASGVGAVAAGTASGRWVAIAHGIVGVAVVLLVPWKSMIVRRGLGRPRARRTRWLSLLLAVLAITALVTGLGSASGLLRSVGDFRGIWLHVAAALALVPLVVWHVLARPAHAHRTDLSRRTLLRAGTLGAAAAVVYLAITAVVRAAGLPGASRRFTGSYEAGSFDPASMPRYIWLNDSIPTVDADRWRLTVIDGDGQYQLTTADLSAYHSQLRAFLDCTSGWYAEQDWTGAPVSALLRDFGDARSLFVHAVTGYWIRFPVDEVDRLLLATAVGGKPLIPGHGFPVRLVAPGRRGFWWVKWVERIETSGTPWWWQPPFPLS
jgi:DMSO/TMAO reductase YedYZ molybdopterin-dependent catalytic subunit